MKADGLKAALVLAFLIAPAPFLSPDAVAADSDGAPREGNLFVGHYGEVLELDPAWTADAEMTGDVELVRMYERKEGRPPPDAALYGRLENYTRHSLIQLIVVPKGRPGGFKTLKELRKAKEEELAKDKELRGLEYTVQNVYLSAATHDRVPPDTFQVEVERPFQFGQVYYQSPERFFILTTGYGLAVDSNLGFVRRSLERQLNRHYTAYIAFDDFYLTWDMLALWGVPNLVFLLLARLPKRKLWQAKLRAAGIAFLPVFNLLMLYGAMAGYLCYKYEWVPYNGSYTLMLLPCLALPWAMKWLSGRLGGDRPGRVFWAQTVVPLWALTGWLWHLRRIGVPGTDEPLWGWAVSLGIGLAWFFGIMSTILFGLAFSPGKEKEEVS